MSADKASKSGGSDVLHTLQTAVRGLTYQSEADKPVKAFLWKPEEVGVAKDAPFDEAALRAAGKAPAGATVKSLTVDEFFAPVAKDQDWFGAEEKAQAERFRDLVKTLKQALTGLTVFRIEPGDGGTITVYAIGQTADGDLAGVTTQLVET